MTKQEKLDKCKKVLKSALSVGEIQFKTCILSAEVHDQIKELLKEL